MDDIFGNFLFNGGIQKGIIEREKQEKRGNVLNTNVGDYTIDSCYTFDEGLETAIWYKDNDMVIVERYSNTSEMKKGHQKWCDFCKDNPKEVYSVQYNKIESLM